MQLEENEVRLLQGFYQRAEDNAVEHIRKLADFYDKFKTVYNKYRHGLIIRTGSTRTDNNNDDNDSNGAFRLEDSSLEALDFKSADDLPKGCKIVDKDVNNLVPGMFNALSHVNFGPKLIREVCTTVDIAQKIVHYVCDNHKRYAMNCGQSYLPITFKEDGRPYLSFLLPDDTLTDEERRLLDSIANKVLGKMNIQPELTVEEFTYKNGKKDNLVQAMLDNTVTNVFVRKSQKENLPD